MPHDCVKRRIQTEPSIASRAHEHKTLNLFRPSGQKCGLELIRITLWQNCRRRTRFFAQQNQPTHRSVICGRRREIMSRRDEIVKKRGVPFSQTQAVGLGSVKPSLRLSLQAGTPSARGVSPEKRQTWHWHVREKDAAFDQCGKRPHRSARGFCSPEFL